jgi:hypothetical protein
VAKVCLKLGCHGNIDDDEFCYCHGVSNQILNIADLSHKDIDEVIDFLNKSSNLIDKPMVDNNKVTNTIAYLYKNFKIFSQEDLHKIQFFMKIHKTCGLKLELVTIDSED